MNKLGIICALHFEARCFTPRTLPAQQPVELNDKSLLILSGMGREPARQAAQKLVEAGADCLAGFGTAGALAPELRPGELVLAQEVWVSQDHDRHPNFFARISGGYPESLLGVLKLCWVSPDEVHEGALACAAEPVATIEAKRKLFGQTGAIAVDMESAGVFDAARRNGLPAFALRAIIDAAQVALPDAVLQRVDEFGEVDAPGLALDLARSPGQIPAVVRLACAARRAGRTMRQAAILLLRHSPPSSFRRMPESSNT